MTVKRFKRWGRCLGLGAVLLALSTGDGSAQTHAQTEEPNPNRPRQFQARNARPQARARLEVMRDRAEARARAEARRQARRAARSVTPPTITPSEVDALVLQTLEATGVEPAQRTTDVEFLRRLTVDLTGKLPNAPDIDAFAQDPDPDKRAKQIDALLETDDYATTWARYWRDVIRYNATFENARLVNYPKLDEWLADQFAANRPWDEIAAELIAATGSNAENGQTVLTLAHQAQPVEVAGEVSRIFLGIQIQCAQCHDHMTDPWTRQQFHEFAAFFAGTRARRDRVDGNLAPSFSINAQGRPRYTMPDLDNPQRRIPIEPKFFLANEERQIPLGLTAQQRRELAAEFVTGQQNPWFPRAFINRLWYELIGEAFYLPIDDLGPYRDAHAPEVLDALATQWQQGGYDIKWLFRTILNTETYQRVAQSTDSAAGRTPFASNCPSRLRSDAIYEALNQVLDLEAPLARARGRFNRGPNAPGQGGPFQGRFGPRLRFDQTFGVDPSTLNEDVLGTIPQALFLMNSPILHQRIAGREGVLTELLREHRDDQTALEALYLRTLARLPNAEEAELCLDYLQQAGNRREGFEDILWSLLNSTEFISRR